MKNLIFINILLTVNKRNLSCFLLSILYSLTTAIAEEYKDHTLKIYLKGIEYDSLYLVGSDMHANIFKIRGIQQRGNCYAFHISDSIYQRCYIFRIQHKLFDQYDQTVGVVDFCCEETNSSISSCLSFDEASSVLLHFIKRDTIRDKKIVKQNDEYNLVDINVEKDLLCISCDIYKNIAMPLLHPDFSFFPSVELDAVDYNELLKKFEEIAIMYPDSRYLVSSLYKNLSNFHSKKDIENIFAHFSSKAKKSVWGSKLQQYLTNNRFENTQLFLLNDESQKEFIIKDSTKFNLVLFSASWCKPCHKQIPLLKQLYDELRMKVDFTYISLDDARSIDKWKALMANEAIPWRSLISPTETKAIQEKYYFEGVPTIILVNPNGNFEFLDLDNKEHLSVLYSIHNDDCSL